MQDNHHTQMPQGIPTIHNKKPPIINADTLDSADSPTFITASTHVVTGHEPRPNADTVFWIGGTEQPINMCVGDVWLKDR